VYPWNCTTAGALSIPGAKILRVHPRAARSREVKVKTLGKRRLKIRRPKLNVRVHRVKLSQRTRPVFIKIRRPGVDPRVRLQFRQGHVEQRHE
jgi:hypothetical protein